MESLIGILSWLGPTAILAALAWFFKLPRQVWEWLLKNAALKYGQFPRRSILYIVESGMWGFGWNRDIEMTQLMFDLKLTNLTKFKIEIIQATFQYRSGFRKHVAPLRVFAEAFDAESIGELRLDGFTFPRITNDPTKILSGRLCLMDQFHNKHYLDVKTVPMPGIKWQPPPSQRKKEEAAQVD